MTEKQFHPEDFADLRRRAEEKAKADKAKIPQTPSPKEAGRLLHELQVHQIELEMQNEELRRAQGELEALRARYFDLFDLAPVGYLSLSEGGLIQEANLTCAGLLGVTRNALVKQPLHLFILPENKDIYYLYRKQLSETGAPQVCELRMLRTDATPFWARLEASVEQDANGESVCRIVMSDITQRKRIEDVQTFLLQCGCAGPGEDFFQALARYLAQSLAMDYVCIDRLLGGNALAQTLAVYNDGKFEDNVTYTLKETPCGDVVGKTICCFAKDVCQLFPNDVALRELKAESYVGTTLWSFEGKPIGLIALIGRKPLVNSFLAESVLKLVAFRAAGEMERKQAERRQHLSTEVLGILNDSSDLAAAIDGVLIAIKQETGFDAVGIRLRNGDDFPYFSQNGFSSDFLLTENTLTVRDQDGGPCRDKNGRLCLECTCGVVLSGQTDPTHPLFTTGGSFWTNNSLPLLDLPADQAPRLHPRNQCIHEGFLSVALIPIRAQGEIVGLLQLNDREKDCFTLDIVHFFEGISASIGATLMRKQAEEEAKSLARFPGENPNPVARIGGDDRLLYANPPAEALLRGLGCAVGGTTPAVWCDWIRQTRDQHAAHPIEWEFEGRTYAIVIAHVAQGGYANLYARDITEGKRAEEALREAKEHLELRVQERTAELEQSNRSLHEEIAERHRAEEATKAERRRLFELLEMLPVYVVLLSTEHRVFFANRFFRERFGESHGRCYFDHLSRRTEPCGTCESYTVLKTGEPHRWQGTGPDGRQYEIHDFPFLDTDGSTLVLEVGVDITDRRKAQLAVEASEARYRSFVTASEQIVWITNAQGVVADDLPLWRAFTGQSLEQLRGWGWVDALHPDDRQSAVAAWSQALATCSLYATEYRVRRHDGEYRWLAVRGVPVIEEGTICEWIGACTDITEHKLAEEALRAKERSLAESQRIAHLGNWKWNAATNHLDWSDEIFRIFDIAPQQFGATYEAFLERVHPEDLARVEQAVHASLADPGIRYNVEHRVVRPDGSHRVLHERGQVTFDRAGKPMHMIGTVHDITERRGADEETRRLKDELAHVERTARMGELAASLAHEINQPLTAILSNAQAARRLLASNAPDLDMFREILDDIIRDDKRAGNVIHRLRRMIQKGKQEPEWFDVNDAILEVVQLLHSETIGRNVAISMDLAPELPAVQAGRIEVQQVMVNLLLNAFDAVQGVRPGHRQILIRTNRDEDAIVVAIRDCGCGIQASDIDSIFESFFTTKPVGLGMGLAICRRMILDHGGRIWAANNEDAGATVSFTLPSNRAGREPRDG